MARAFTPILTMPLLILWPTLQLRAQEKPANNCQIIGRTLDNFEDVCADQPIKTPSIKFLCFSNKKHLVATSVKDLAACPKPKAINLSPSSANPNQLIKRTRGPAEKSGLRIQLADKNFLPDSLPFIKWTTAEGALSYRVEVRNSAQKAIWRITSQKPEVQYPANAAKLETDKLYRVIVTALDSSKRPLANDIQTFRILSKENAADLNTATKTINQMEITEDQKALDLTAIYISDGLRSKGRHVLKQRVASNSTQPEIYTLFANLCLQEGDIQGAMSKLKKAQHLAIEQNNDPVLQESTAALNSLKSSQSIHFTD